MAKLEKKMFVAICDKIDSVVCTVNPTQHIGIFVDGCAPIAKQDHQRRRRYGSVSNQIALDRIELHWSKLASAAESPPTPRSEPTNAKQLKWTNSCITPGTTFMTNLMQHIRNYINCQLPIWQATLGERLTVEFSSCDERGEGEHKIFRSIKERNRTDADIVRTIHGLDADLIFLSMSSMVNNLWLIRDDGERNSLEYCSIDRLSETVFEMFRKYGNIPIPNSNNQKRQLLDDMVLMCFFIGNDFIPTVPGLSVFDGGLRRLVSCYGQAVSISALRSAPTFGLVIRSPASMTPSMTAISLPNLSLLLSELVKHEHQMLFNTNRSWHKRKYPPSHIDGIELDKWKLMNLFDVSPKLRSAERVQLGVGTRECYAERYYDRYFDGHRRPVVEEWVSTMEWITRYYFDSEPSWYKRYNYHHSPLLGEIDSTLRSMLETDAAATTTATATTVVSMDTRTEQLIQMLSVFPPEYKKLVPKKYRDIYNDKRFQKYCPHNGEYKIDYYLANRNYEGKLEIDFVPHRLVLQLITEVDEMYSRNAKGSNSST